MLPFVSKMFITLIVLYNSETSKKKDVFMSVNMMFFVFMIHMC